MSAHCYIKLELFINTVNCSCYTYLHTIISYSVIRQGYARIPRM